MLSLHFPAGQREIVAALFIVQPELLASSAPLASMCGDAASACAMMREKVREFVAQCAVDFIVAKFAEARVERHE